MINSRIFEETVQFRLISPGGDVHADRHTAIPAIDDIVEETPIDKKDPSKGTKLINRKIRYVPGESSIYADEQSDFVKERELKPIIMVGTQLFVSKAELLKREYLSKSNFNKNNKLRKPEKSALYYEYDREAEYKKALNSEIPFIEAQAKVLDMHITEMKALIMIASNDYAGVTSNISNMDVSEIKHICLNIAKTKPELITQGLKTKSQRNKYLILQGITQGVLVYDERQELLTWANGDVISKSPLGKNAIDYFVDRTSADDIEAEANMDEIKRRVSFEIESDSESTEKSPEMLLLEKAIKYNLVGLKGNWHTYIDSDNEIEVKTNGSALFIKEMEENDDLFISIKKAVKALSKK